MKTCFFTRTLTLAASLALQLSSLCFHSRAATSDVDVSFDAGFFPGVPVWVRAVAVQPDGKVIIAGTGIARLNADGSKDSSFDRPYDPNVPVGQIYAVALQADGKVLMAHDYGVSRLNSEGNWDTNFVSPSIRDDNLSTAGVRAVAVQSDGKIFIAGGFRIVDGQMRNSVARLNADGSLDNTFIPETIDNFFSGAFCMALQSDGKVLIGGQALTWRNDSVARLNADGSMDGHFFSVSADVFVSSIAVQPDGKVLIGGRFTSVTATNRAGFARLSADGSLDNGFNPGTGVKAFAAQADGKVLVGGDSLTIGGTNLKGIARLDSNGNLDNTFSPELSPHPSISTITLQADGKVLISGPDVTGDVRPDYNLLTRLSASGSRDGTFIAGAYRGSWANWMMAQPSGQLIIGGWFPFIDGTNQASVARLNVDGSLDSILSTNTGLEHAVLQPDGKWLVGDGSPEGMSLWQDRQNVRFNADWSVDNSFTSPVVDNQIYAAAAQSDGKVLIGGQFSTVNGTNRNGIARLNADGSLDTTFVAEVAPGSSIYSVLGQPDGKILIGGEFSSADQAHHYGLVRLNADASFDSSFNHVAGADIRNIALQPDGKVLITGYFSYVHGARRDYIARLNADGSLDTTFDAGSYNDNPASQYVSGAGPITLQPDGKLLVIGVYYLGNDELIQGFYRLNTNGSVDASLNPSGGLPFDVRSVAAQPDGKVLISGGFLAVNGVARPYLARLIGDAGGPPNAAPTVTVDSPADGATFAAPATIAISVGASDSDGTIAQVDVYAGDTLIASDNSAPFEVTWNNVAPGNYVLTADATDNLGAVATSAAVHISVTNAAPLVSISRPTDGATFAAPATIAISVDASDSDGTIAQVNVYAGATLIGSDNAAPFEVTWNNPAAGDYALTADATDNLGTTRTSSAVNIHVTAPGPPAAPSGLTAAAISRKQIDLSWSDPATNELGFKIVRSTNGKPFKQIAKVGPNVTTFSNTDLAAGNKYSYRVRAYNTLGSSPYSSTATARTSRRLPDWLSF